MSDTNCTVCGEPWSVDHVNHDMPLWKQTLFRAGKGCEACEGTPPQGGVSVDGVGRDLLRGGDDQDPTPAIHRLGDPPKDFSELWAEPEPLVLATCDGCGTKAELAQDEIWPVFDKKNGKWVGSVFIGGSKIRTPLASIGPSKMHDWMDVDSAFDFQPWLEKVLCAACRTRCASCDDELFDGKALEKFCLDTYDTGNSFPTAGGEAVCVGCVEEGEDE